MSIRFKKGVAAVLNFVLVVATVFAGNWITSKAANGNIPVKVTPNIENADGTNFNLEWNVYDSGDTRQAGSVINFNQSNNNVEKTGSLTAIENGYAIFRLQTAGCTTNGISLRTSTTGSPANLSNEDVTALTGEGYRIYFSDVDTIDFTINLSGNNGQGGPGTPGNPEGPGNPGDPAGPEVGGQTFLDVTVNGEKFSKVGGDSVINLAGAFNIDTLTYTIDKVYTAERPEGVALINVGNKSGVTDSQGRNPLAIQTIDSTENSVTLNWEYHVEGDSANRGAPGFYIINVTIAGKDYEGMKIDAGAKPDMYDDTVYTDKVDIGSSTAENPAKTAVYYGNDAIDLSTVDGAKSVSKIEVVTGTNPNAVTITGTSVKFNSPYYASIPLKVTLSDGTIGYITVDRLGLELRDYGNTGTTLHGSHVGTSISSASGVGEKNIIATFYYDAAQSYTDYNIVANLVFADGSTKTVVVVGYDDKTCETDSSLKGGDYLVWSGKADEEPVSVSVTAVKAGATSGNTFGGACFGAGTGVSKTFR